MYTRFQSAFHYLKYYFSASNGKGHGTHSPFIFDFIKNVLNADMEYPVEVEQLREKLKKDRTILRVDDLGAGIGRSGKRSVASIAKRSLKPEKFGKLFYRIIRKYKPGTIIELGTSLGITTCYLSLADPSATVYTLEGSEEIADLAKKHFDWTGLSNVELIKGNFDEKLPGLLTRISRVDLAFIDGNHRQETTERYFRQLLTIVNNDSIIILDDIHWSPGMEQAWENIKKNDSVTCSIDLYFTGILFFRKEFLEKRHFVIRF